MTERAGNELLGKNCLCMHIGISFHSISLNGTLYYAKIGSWII